MQGTEAVIILIASLHIDLLERIIYVLNQECGIEVPLDFRAIRHRVPAFAETFLCIGFRQMVKLACLYGEGIDFLERTSRIKYLSLDGFNKQRRSFIEDGFSEPFLSDVLPLAVEFCLLRLFCQSTEPHLFDVMLAAKRKQAVRQLIMLLDRNCCAGTFVLVFYISKQRSIDSKRFD